MVRVLRGGLLILALTQYGCSAMWAGAGAAGTAAVYETGHKHDLEELDEAYQRGEIDRDEYLRQKDAIEDRSIVY